MLALLTHRSTSPFVVILPGGKNSRRNWTSRRPDDTPGPHALTLRLEASIMPEISEWLAVLRETRRMSRELCIAPYLRLQPQAASHIEEHNCSCDFDSRRWRRVL